MTASVANGHAGEAIARILVLSPADAGELAVLKGLPPGATVVGVGTSLQELQNSLTDADWRSVNVLLSFGPPVKGCLQDIWPRLPNLEWLHSTTAGVEHIMFPDLRDGPVTLTNAKGNYSHGLAEHTIAACLWFAKDLPRYKRQQKAKEWQPYNVEYLRGKTLGVVGYGDIGQAAARMARVFGMRILALRRRVELSAEEEAEGLQVYPPDELCEMMAASDYVLMALPLTPETHHLVGAAAIAAMRPHGVLINVGRGKNLDEAALIEALREKRIRGAALDVTEVEPLPKDSPLWDLDNVLISPHSADQTATYEFEAMEQFVAMVERFVRGEALTNIVDKQSGY